MSSRETSESKTNSGLRLRAVNDFDVGVLFGVGSGFVVAAVLDTMGAPNWSLWILSYAMVFGSIYAYTKTVG